MSEKPIRIIAFVGSSGTGKPTIVKWLLTKFPQLFMLITSLTTRLKRVADLLHEYGYLSDDDFDRLVDIGAFEGFVGPHGNRYGTPKSLLENAAFGYNEVILGKKFSIMIITPDAAEKLYKLYPEITLFFFICPAERRELQRRLVSRGDKPGSIDRRITDCENWFSESLESSVPYIYLSNPRDQIEKTLAVVESYLI